MADKSFNHVVGGRLKLKGSKLAVLPPTGGKKRRKKRREEKEMRAVVEEDRTVLLPVDPRTPAEKAHEEKMKAREDKVIHNVASQTHRERVEKFNDVLAAQTDHFDIPKVASAGLG